MAGRIRAGLCATLVVLTACTAAGETPSASTDKVCEGDSCISVGRFGQSINDQLKDKVVGYVAIAGTSQVSAGQARKAIDPPALTMGPDVVVNTASVGKMFTTIAVLKSLTKHNLTVDDKILPFLPPDWPQGPGVDRSSSTSTHRTSSPRSTTTSTFPSSATCCRS